jgi:hypothetical protein
MRIALATCSRFPDLHEDDRALADALRARGVEVVPAIWNDARVAWGSFALIAIRNTWDYYEQRDAFLAWVDRASRATTVANPPSVVVWNTHKGYLRDLAARGIDVVPTAWCPRGDPVDLDALLEARGPEWDVAVVKPAVSAGANDTMRVTKENRSAARALLARIVARCDAMIQPYLAAVEGHGERSLLFAGDEFSHSVRKHALLAPGAVDPEHQDKGVPSVEASAEEIAFAARVMAAAKSATGESFAYARVDIAPGPKGPLLMELEVTEPSLFLRSDPEAPNRFAEALLAAANAAQRRRA